VSNATDFYREKLGFRGVQRKKAREAALARSHEIRQFEIELYWKRANYFWLLQAAVFAAVGLTWKADGSAIPAFVPLILASLGVVTALGGWLATQGSKFWQRNWEHHIDMLETEFEGNLYKCVYVGPSGVKWSLSGISESLGLCFVGFWALVLSTVSVWANPNWFQEGARLTFCLTRMELLTLLSWVFALSCSVFLYRQSGGLKGTPQHYPEDFGMEGTNPGRARFSKDPAAKPYLLRRKPQI
jgi:hypothetical protein